MTRDKALVQIEEMDRQLVMLEHIGSVLSWDQEIAASKKGLDERASQMGWISSQAHELACGEQMGEALSALGADRQHPEGSGVDDFEKALIRIRFRAWDKNRSMSTELVRKISETASRAHDHWVEARNQNDWDVFKPDLQEVLELAKEKAECYKREGSSLYDGLLDDFEEGMKASQVTTLFASIKPRLVDLVQKLSEKQVDDSFLRMDYPVDKQEAFAKLVLDDMGFDFSRGSRAVSVHPFTSTLGCDDIRITTRYTDPSVMDSFSSTVHEGGHALYEMGASWGRQKGTSISNGASFGMHESQSRLWENMIGKNENFWIHYYPMFKEIFPSQTDGISLDRFVKAINKVEPGCIRVNADEVGYSLHIMLRFELEQDMFSGKISLDDLPSAWNEKSREMLGIVPKTFAEGVLQDVHWSSGDFGYFPTYALGNLYGAQIWERMRSEMDVDALLKRGKLGEIGSFLDTHVYKKGSLYKSSDLLGQVTGKPLDATFFSRYLEDKFSCLFGC